MKRFWPLLLGALLLMAFGFYALRQITPGADRHSRRVEILVFEDLDGNGERSKHETPIPNTLIIVTTNVHGNFNQSVMLTDDAGKASIQAEYTHYFDLHPLPPCGYIHSTPALVSALDGKKHEFGFQPADGKTASPQTSSLVFTLWQDTNQDGVRQPNEPPLDGVELEFSPVLGTYPKKTSDVGSFFRNEFSATTDEAGKITLNVGNSCGTLEVAPVAGWKTTTFSLNNEIKEIGTMTFDYDDNTPEIFWGLSKHESFSLTAGGAHHPDGMGQWVIHLYANGTFTARHNLQDTTTKYGPYTPTDEEFQELWALVATANIESLPRTFKRPGIPDETAYKFALHTVDQVYLSEMWVDDVKGYPEVQALVERLIELMESYTGKRY